LGVSNKYHTYNRDLGIGYIYDYLGDCYSLTFFFEQFKKHYLHLDETVFRTLAIDNTNNKSKLLNYLKLDVYFPPDYYYEDALLHMKKDRSDIPGLVDDLRIEIKNYDCQVEKLVKLIDGNILNYVKRSFRKIDPLKLHSYTDFGNDYVRKETIKNIVLEIWKRNITSIDIPTDIQTICKKIDDEIRCDIIRFKKDFYPFYQLLHNSTDQIGVGNNEQDMKDIQTIFINDLLKNEKILGKLVYLVNKKNSLENENIFKIRNLCNQYSIRIEKSKYRTKAKCCPDLWRLFRQYFFPF
jgi:hypothetical protein